MDQGSCPTLLSLFRPSSSPTSSNLEGADGPGLLPYPSLSVVVVGGEEQDDFLKALKNLSLSSSSTSSLPTDLTLKKIDTLPKLRTERTPPIIDFLTFLRDFRRKMKNYVSQKLAWIRYLIEAVNGVGRREIRGGKV